MSAEKELTGIETKIEMAKQAVQKQTETLEQLNTEQKELGQEDSDIQQKLDMLKEFSIKKNQALAEAINIDGPTLVPHMENPIWCHLKECSAKKRLLPFFRLELAHIPMAIRIRK